MKTTLAAIAAIALAGSAHATHFGPYNTPFTMTGSLEYEGNDAKVQHCSYTFSGEISGKTQGGLMTINSATMCPRMTPSNLPWVFHAGGRRDANGIATISVVGTSCSTSQMGFDIKNEAVQWGGVVFGTCYLYTGTGETSPIVKIYVGK